jgi:hypothetical protein
MSEYIYLRCGIAIGSLFALGLAALAWLTFRPANGQIIVLLIPAIEISANPFFNELP